MSHDYRHHMLKCIGMEPRTLLFFTEGEACLRIAARHVESYVAAMVAEGLIFLGDNRYFITDAGRAELAKPPTTPGPRTWCSASIPSSEPYRTPAWPTREGGDAHLQHKSHSTWGIG